MPILDLKELAQNATSVYQSGDFNNAARLYGEAASIFLDQGQDLDAAELKNNQSVALLRAGDAQGAFEAAHGTPAVFFASGDSRREGIAFANEAAALADLGRTDEASGIYQRAADALEKAGEDQMRANVMQALSLIQLRKGKALEALLSMQLGLAGVRHPTLKQKILRSLLRLRV